MKPQDVLKQYKGKRLIVENAGNYIKILAINSIEVDEVLDNIPMWLRNKIPKGISCIEINNIPEIQLLTTTEELLIIQIQQRRLAADNLSKDSTKNDRMLLAMLLGRSVSSL